VAETAPHMDNGIVPHITVDGASDAIAFYVKAFGARELLRHPAPDGRIMHATLAINGGILMLNDSFQDRGGTGSPKSIGGTAVTLHIDVPDPDAVFERAVAAGATPIMPMADMFWGARYGQVVDPFGHRWSIACPARPVDAAAIEAGARKYFG